ncbi:MAG TPA: TIGR04076 family protein [Bryobacteraceae bacterium]|nr:TIGR04076 family protein [Bryobacteraceae bacterium]
MARCRIRVLMRTVMASLAEQYVGDPVRPCPLLRDGQEFDVPASLEKPPGMCDWAWNDIHKFVAVLSRGGNFSQDIFAGWMKSDDCMIACCTDGVRPVFFEIKRLGD